MLQEIVAVLHETPKGRSFASWQLYGSFLGTVSYNLCLPLSLVLVIFQACKAKDFVICETCT